MVDDGRWEVVSAKPAANRASKLPRMEDNGHEVWAEARKTSARAGGQRQLRGRWEVTPVEAEEGRHRHWTSDPVDGRSRRPGRQQTPHQSYRGWRTMATKRGQRRGRRARWS
jgi:hypothetical protein